MNIDIVIDLILINYIFESCNQSNEVDNFVGEPLIF